jgi:hypothetical protein
MRRSTAPADRAGLRGASSISKAQETRAWVDFRRMPLTSFTEMLVPNSVHSSGRRGRRISA